MRVGRFEPFEVNLTTGELRKHGIRLRVQDQPFQILALLLARPETLVTREEICQRLWPSGTFVDFDNGLNTALSRLREALGDSAESPRYIETLARRGYRWMVSVDWSTSPSADLPASDSVDASSELEVSLPVPHDFDRSGSWGSRAKHVYGSLFAIALIALGLGWFWFKGQLSVHRNVLRERQITHNLSDSLVKGSEVSRDGKYVAYTDKNGLHLSTIESGEGHDIALPDELRTNLHAVTWFPDGEKLIVDAWNETEGHVLWLISIFGGVPRKLRAHSFGARVSPNGSSIAFLSGSPGDAHEIWLAGADGENARKMQESESDNYGSIAWSPSAQRLSYLKLSANSEPSIQTLSLDGGLPSGVVLDSELLISNGAVWLPDGRLIFSTWDSTSENEAGLWEIKMDPRSGLPSGKPAKITNWPAIFATLPSVSKDGKRLVVAKSHTWDDIYVGELKEHATRLGTSKRLTSNDSFNYPFAWARDSRTILFTSNRMGRYQIFKQRLGTDTAELLVKSPADLFGGVFSADAAWILYSSEVHGGESPLTSIRWMRFPVSGGSPEQILETPVDRMIGFDCPLRPSSSCLISRGEQGQLIFNALDPVKGQGKEVIRTRLERAYDLHFSISPDGSHIAIGSRDQLRGQVRLIDLQNNTERNLHLPQGWVLIDLNWAVDSNILVAAINPTEAFIAQIDLDGKTHILFEQHDVFVGNPCLSPDGRYLAYYQENFSNNIWLLENF